MDFIKFNCPSHPALQALASKINNEAIISKVPPCALAAIVARETGGRNVLQDGCSPGPGCGVGLTQITAGVNWGYPQNPTFQGYELMDEEQNLYVAGAFFLKPAIDQCLALRAAHADAMQKPILYYAFCAYNAGLGAIIKALHDNTDPDEGTTDHYGAGTLAFYDSFVFESHTQEGTPPGV